MTFFIHAMRARATNVSVLICGVCWKENYLSARNESLLCSRKVVGFLVEVGC